MSSSKKGKEMTGFIRFLNAFYLLGLMVLLMVGLATGFSIYTSVCIGILALVAVTVSILETIYEE